MNAPALPLLAAAVALVTSADLVALRPVPPDTPAEPASAARRVSSRSVRAEISVAASRPEVYAAWTTRAGLESFFAERARVELSPNGPFEIEFNLAAPKGQRGSEGCRVLAYVPDELLAVSWNAPPKFGALREERTFVVIQLRDDGPRATRVSLTHAGFGAGRDWEAIADYFEKAWPFVLGNLAKRFEKPTR